MLFNKLIKINNKMKIKLFKANRIRTVFTILTIIVIGISCHKNIISEFDTNSEIKIQVINNEKIDLLNPESLGSLNTENIKIYIKKDGELVEYTEPNMTTPHGYSIDFEGNQWFLKLSPIKDQNEKIYTTYIKWNCTDDMDTVNLQSLQNDKILEITK